MIKECMKIIDLTHNLEEGMPVYPGTESPQIKIETTIEGEGFEERLLTLFSHTGTHMDAPCHIVKCKKSLSDFDVSDFMGKAVLIDVQGMSEITHDIIEEYADKLKDAKFAVLFSGWDKYWGYDEYFTDFPVLTMAATELLTRFDLTGICMDMISIDYADTETFDNHKLVFDKNMLIVENLTNLDKVKSMEFDITCMPLRIKDGDGSPVRAFATFH